MLEEVGITTDRILSMQRGHVLLQEAPDYARGWLVVFVLVCVRDRPHLVRLLGLVPRRRPWRVLAEPLSPGVGIGRPRRCSRACR
jgi:hypothetical protein